MSSNNFVNGDHEDNGDIKNGFNNGDQDADVLKKKEMLVKILERFIRY
jgi:hypothetical protein